MKRIGYLIDDSIKFNGEYRVLGSIRTTIKNSCRINVCKEIDLDTNTWYGKVYNVKLSFDKKYAKDVDEDTIWYTVTNGELETS